MVCSILQCFSTEAKRFEILSMVDDCGRTTLFYLPPISVLSALRGLDVDKRRTLIRMTDKSAKNVLHSVDYTWSTEAVLELLDIVGTYDICFKLLAAQDDTGRTPLFCFKAETTIAVLKLFNTEQKLMLIQLRDRCRKTRLHIASDGLKPDLPGIFDLFVSNEICFTLLTAQDYCGKTPLFYWCAASIIEILSRLTIEHCLEVIDKRDNLGKIFLHALCCHNWSEADIVGVLNILASDEQRYSELSSQQNEG